MVEPEGTNGVAPVAIDDCGTIFSRNNQATTHTSVVAVNGATGLQRWALSPTNPQAIPKLTPGVVFAQDALAMLETSGTGTYLTLLK